MPPLVVGYEIAGRCLPTFEIGGDYYDYIELSEDLLGLVIADVSGKGTAAALSMIAFREVGGLPLGIFSDSHYETGVALLERGDVVLFYTDGVVEGRDSPGEEFGIERLISVVTGARQLAVPVMLDEIFRATRAHCGADAFDDDLTVMIVRRAPWAGGLHHWFECDLSAPGCCGDLTDSSPYPRARVASGCEGRVSRHSRQWCSNVRGARRSGHGTRQLPKNLISALSRALSNSLTLGRFRRTFTLLRARRVAPLHLGVPRLRRPEPRYALSSAAACLAPLRGGDVSGSAAAPALLAQLR